MGSSRRARWLMLGGLTVGFLMGVGTGAEAQSSCPNVKSCMRKYWDGEITLWQYRNPDGKWFCQPRTGQTLAVLSYPQDPADARYRAGTCLSF